MRGNELKNCGCSNMGVAALEGVTMALELVLEESGAAKAAASERDAAKVSSHKSSCSNSGCSGGGGDDDNGGGNGIGAGTGAASTSVAAAATETTEATASCSSAALGRRRIEMRRASSETPSTAARIAVDEVFGAAEAVSLADGGTNLTAGRVSVMEVLALGGSGGRVVAPPLAATDVGFSELALVSEIFLSLPAAVSVRSFSILALRLRSACLASDGGGGATADGDAEREFEGDAECEFGRTRVIVRREAGGNGTSKGTGAGDATMSRSDGNEDEERIELGAPTTGAGAGDGTASGTATLSFGCERDEPSVNLGSNSSFLSGLTGSDGWRANDGARTMAGR